MEPPHSFVVAPTTGSRPAIERLLAMMTYARWTTISAVHGLTMAQLDHSHDHAGAFDAALELGEHAQHECRGRELAFYLDLLREVRQFTTKQLSTRDDRRLEEVAPFDEVGGKPANNHFKWFHVMEDELNHRGQIRGLRQRLPRQTE